MHEVCVEISNAVMYYAVNVMPLVFKIDHMQDHVYVWDIINLMQRGRWRGANQRK